MMKDIADICHALADECRVEIVSMLANGEMNHEDLLDMFSMSSLELSRHMEILKNIGLVEVIDEYYSLNYETLCILSQFLDGLDFVCCEDCY